MKTKFIFVVTTLTLFILVFEKSNAQSPDWLWAHKIGGTSSDKGQAVATDAFGNVYTTGSFKGQVDFDPRLSVNYISSAGDLDIFISKLDGAGNFLWAKTFEGNNTDEGLSITIDALGNVYTTGYFQGTVDFDPGPGAYNLTAAGIFDVFVSKLDGSGNFIWAKRMGGTGTDEGKSIAIDSAGNIFSAGYFSGTADFNPDSINSFNLTTSGGHDIFVSKLDNQGNFVWAKAMGGAGGDECLDLILDASGNVFTTGYFVQTADFDPGVGVVNITSAGSGDIFISKLDSSGNFVWAKSMGGTGFAIAYSIAIDLTGNGDVYTTGYFSTTVDFDPGLGIASISSNGNDDVFITELDSSCNFIWAKAIGGTNADYGQSLAISSTGKIYLAGWFSSASISFGTFSVANTVTTGFPEILIAKLDNLINGIESSVNDNSVSVYPNPARDQLIIELNGIHRNIEITFSDLTGKIIPLKIDNSAETMHRIECNVLNHSPGIYLMQIKTEDFIETKRIVLTK